LGSFYGKACLSVVYNPESSEFPRIIRGKFPVFLEYLRQIKTKFEDSSRRSSGAHEVLFYEKIQESKNSCHSPF
jgi:hypothetical protein